MSRKRKKFCISPVYSPYAGKWYPMHPYFGDPELVAFWKNPHFDAEQRAFYCARVLEFPTPRWTAFDAKLCGTEPPADATMILQERAYTSPICYTP